MNVLSLFDGMSCGQIALNRLGIKYDNYYAAEIDKYAIEVTKKNFPNTIHLGDVTKVKAADLEPIDLLMGGSPCQGFSFAGKQLNFDDPRSALFFEFVRLLKECKPQYFLLENVRMKKIYQDVITEHLGVEPIMINSSLLSAQNRLRLYWTNIPGVKQPEDRGLVLRDILEYNQTSVSELSEAKKDRVLNSQRGKGFFYNPDQHDKIGTLVAGYHKEPTDGSYLEIHKPVKDTERNRRHYKEVDEKSLCMTSTMYKGAGNNGMTLVPIKNPERVKETPNYWQMDVSGKGYASQQDRIRKLDKPSNSLAAGSASIPKVMCGAFRGRYNEEGKTEQQLEIRKDEKTNSITTVQKDNVVVELPEKSQTIKSQYYKSSRANFERSGTFHATGIKNEMGTYRKLTPIECERLQTVPDNYTQGVSNTQRYKMLGNGWTVDVIAHILKNIHEENNHTLQTERTPTRDTQRSQEI